MAYSSRHGRRPQEFASRSSHSHVIRDPVVSAFLGRCNLPAAAEDVTIRDDQIVCVEPDENPIKHFVAVDGGYSEVPVRTEFPSATVCFFQFGALFFALEDLLHLERQAFIDPEDMARLKNIQRFKLVIPVRNMSLDTETSLTHSVRRALHEFFVSVEDPPLIHALRWLVFQEYRGSRPSNWDLASCPTCGQGPVRLRRRNISKEYTFHCQYCEEPIYLIDVFRLHEAIDDELGAGGILGYLTVTVEQMLIAHLIRTILLTKPGLLHDILFIKDGPLAFFGQTANMHKPMRELVKWLFEQHNLFLAGLEKSGPFVEHADEIAGLIEPGTAILLDDDYIYKYVLPARGASVGPYGRTTYYGSKLIYKTRSGAMYVATLPTADIIERPTAADLRNLNTILTNIEALRCDMYDSALIPVALANKLVSLANHPSSRILQAFAREAVPH